MSGAISILSSPMNSLPTFFIASAASARAALRDRAAEADAEQRPDQDLPVAATVGSTGRTRGSATAKRGPREIDAPDDERCGEAASAAAIPSTPSAPAKRRGQYTARMKYTAGMDAQRFHKLAEELAGRDPQLDVAAARRARGGARPARARVRGGRGVPPARRRELGASLSGTHRGLGGGAGREARRLRCSSASRAGGSSCSASRSRAVRARCAWSARSSAASRKVRAPRRRCAGPRSEELLEERIAALVREAAERLREHVTVRVGQPEHGQARGGAARARAVLREGRGRRLRRRRAASIRSRSASPRSSPGARNRARGAHALGRVRSRRRDRGRSGRAVGDRDAAG